MEDLNYNNNLLDEIEDLNYKVTKLLDDQKKFKSEVRRIFRGVYGTEIVDAQSRKKQKNI